VPVALLLPLSNWLLRTGASGLYPQNRLHAGFPGSGCRVRTSAFPCKLPESVRGDNWSWGPPCLAVALRGGHADWGTLGFDGLAAACPMDLGLIRAVVPGLRLVQFCQPGPLAIRRLDGPELENRLRSRYCASSLFA